MSVLKLKIARNKFAGKDNPHRFFFYERRDRKYIYGRTLDMKKRKKFCVMSPRELDSWGYEDSIEIVSTISLVVPGLEELDELYNELNGVDLRQKEKGKR